MPYLSRLLHLSLLEHNDRAQAPLAATGVLRQQYGWRGKRSLCSALFG